MIRRAWFLLAFLLPATLSAQTDDPFAIEGYRLGEDRKEEVERATGGMLVCPAPPDQLGDIEICTIPGSTQYPEFVFVDGVLRSFRLVLGLERLTAGEVRRLERRYGVADMGRGEGATAALRYWIWALPAGGEVALAEVQSPASARIRLRLLAIDVRGGWQAVGIRRQRLGPGEAGPVR